MYVIKIIHDEKIRETIFVVSITTKIFRQQNFPNLRYLLYFVIPVLDFSVTVAYRGPQINNSSFSQQQQAMPSVNSPDFFRKRGPVGIGRGKPIEHREVAGARLNHGYSPKCSEAVTMDLPPLSSGPVF